LALQLGVGAGGIGFVVTIEIDVVWPSTSWRAHGAFGDRDVIVIVEKRIVGEFEDRVHGASERAAK